MLIICLLLLALLFSIAKSIMNTLCEAYNFTQQLIGYIIYDANTAPYLTDEQYLLFPYYFITLFYTSLYKQRIKQ